MAEDCSVGGIMIEQQNSGSGQKRNMFYLLCTWYVLVPVKDGTRSGFSKCRNPSSVPGFQRNPVGMHNLVWNCISNLIGSPIGQEEAMLCQGTFNNLDQSHARIAACVSCCERLLSADGQQGIVEMKIDDLPSGFLLTELQIERLTALPQYIVQNHIQVINHNGTFYHLNPDLVFDVNQIVLCRVCAENPMTKDQESIAAGNDYG
jgi:hypothetical protein